MNPNFIQAREMVAKAREAMRHGDSATARALAEEAAMLAPDLEDAWLVLAASDPNPEDALAYARKALTINPQSTRARRGVEWAEGRLKQARGETEAVRRPAASQTKMITSAPSSKPRNRLWLYGGTLALLACVVFGFAAWSAATSPAFADILESAPAPTHENLWAQVNIAKPSVTPIVASAFAQAEATPTAIPTLAPTLASAPDVPTLAPTSLPSELPAAPIAATETPAVLAMDIVADTPTSEYIPPATQAANAQSSYPAEGNGARWIDVDLTNQRVYAYEGDVVVNSFVVSTGTWMTPTVTGRYKIWIKLKSSDMSGPGYHLADVPYVMYFHKGYGLHGTYWHNNFGTPMSHGCVNLTIGDAGWLYNWASVGTVVNVHY